MTVYNVGTAARVVTFGCDVDAGIAPAERWDDVPAVSESYAAARDRIAARVERLVADLARG